MSRAARIQGGATGPRLEGQLAEHGLTLRHFPQSFEFSTLGGWIATRAAGHFATLWTHMEDFLESARAITPSGEWVSRRLPGSGAGPSPDRMLAGSEGVLGVITEAWVRVQPRPGHRRSAGVRFESFGAGAECVRAISQAGLHPSNCRLIDAREARMTLAGDGTCGAARARLRVHRPSRRRVDDAGARAVSRARRRGRLTVAPASERAARVRRRGRLLAPGVPAGSVHARRVRGHGRDQRHLRDGDHLGALSRLSRGADGRGRRGRARGDGRAAPARRTSRAASRMSIRTVRRPTTPSSHPAAAERRSSSGRRSSRRYPTW